jgi:hypothetical protein
MNPGSRRWPVATLALGVGANAAVFTLINGVVLHPFPYRDADRLICFTRECPRPTSCRCRSPTSTSGATSLARSSPWVRSTDGLRS